MAVEAPRETWVREAFPELELIADRELAQAVVAIWAETWERSGWERLEDLPKNHHTVALTHSTVAHTRSVTQQCVAIARAIDEHHGLRCDMDLLVAASLLHDVSKLLESEPGDDGPRTSRFGELIQHGTYAMHMAWKYGLSDELVHVIGSHTTQSRLAPATLEAVIVHYADFVDSDALMWELGRHKLLLTAAR
jgi:putative nucleotidyltransferase with HDIG domain